MFGFASFILLLLLGTAWVSDDDVWPCAGGDDDAWVCAGAGDCWFVFL